MNRRELIRLGILGLATVLLKEPQVRASSNPNWALGERGSADAEGSRQIDWRKNYPLFVVEIKAWVDVDGKSGYETIPQVAIDGDPNFNSVNAPFRLRLDETHRIEAIPQLGGKKFVFWQSEKTSMIQRNPALEFNNESDVWWANYY